MPDLPTPAPAFGIILRGFSTTFSRDHGGGASWYVHGLRSTDMRARAACLLLRRQVIEGEGSRFASGDMRYPTIFRSLFSLLIRRHCRWYQRRRCGLGLDGLVRFLNGMSERHVVPGRVYSAWG